MAAAYLKYKPTTFTQIILPAQIKEMLEKMRAKNFIQPMLFFGEPGCGKTLTASLLREGAFVLRCDGEFSPSEVLDRARRAATTYNIEYPEVERLIVLDEIDRLDKRFQDKVRDLIDSTGQYAAFVATTNHLDNVSDALKSRMKPIAFSIDRNNLSLRQEWKQWLEEIYREEFGTDAESEIMENAFRSFPDARNMISTLLTGYMQ